MEVYFIASAQIRAPLSTLSALDIGSNEKEHHMERNLATVGNVVSMLDNAKYV